MKQLLEQFAEGWATVPPDQFAKAEQAATVLRDELAAQGVDLDDEDVLVAYGTLVGVIDRRIQTHHGKGCCSDRTEMMIGHECWKTLGELTMLLASRRSR